MSVTAAIGSAVAGSATSSLLGGAGGGMPAPAMSGGGDSQVDLSGPVNFGSGSAYDSGTGPRMDDLPAPVTRGPGATPAPGPALAGGQSGGMDDLTMAIAGFGLVAGFLAIKG